MNYLHVPLRERSSSKRKQEKKKRKQYWSCYRDKEICVYKEWQIYVVNSCKKAYCKCWFDKTRGQREKKASDNLIDAYHNIRFFTACQYMHTTHPLDKDNRATLVISSFTCILRNTLRLLIDNPCHLYRQISDLHAISTLNIKSLLPFSVSTSFDTVRSDDCYDWLTRAQWRREEGFWKPKMCLTSAMRKCLSLPQTALTNYLQKCTYLHNFALSSLKIAIERDWNEPYDCSASLENAKHFGTSKERSLKYFSQEWRYKYRRDDITNKFSFILRNDIF